MNQKEIREYLEEQPDNLIVYGINIKDIRSVYNHNTKEMERMKQYCPEHLERCIEIVKRLMKINKN